MAKECVTELTRNYTASEFIKIMRDFSSLTGDTISKDYALLVECLVEKEYGYDVTMNVLREDHSVLIGFDDDLIERSIAFLNKRGVPK